MALPPLRMHTRTPEEVRHTCTNHYKFSALMSLWSRDNVQAKCTELVVIRARMSDLLCTHAHRGIIMINPDDRTQVILHRPTCVVPSMVVPSFCYPRDIYMSMCMAIMIIPPAHLPIFHVREHELIQSKTIIQKITI